MSSLALGAVAVVLLNLYAALLILLRSKVYGVALYRPMLLNVALSFLPVMLALVFGIGLFAVAPLLGRLSERAAEFGPIVLWIYLGIAVAVWLLFFPNAIYLITELNFSHRADMTPVPLWYDIIQTLALTLSGIANAVLSLGMVQLLFVLLIDPNGDAIPVSSWVFAGAIIILGALGVYLGRYLRFNSWDVTHPRSMIRKLSAHLRERGKALEAVGFVATHAVLVALLYVPLYALAWAALT